MLKKKDRNTCSFYNIYYSIFLLKYVWEYVVTIIGWKKDLQNRIFAKKCH